jgi:hypothetical protein
MSWASTRVTTFPEDGAYCLMGIFGVNMPLLYGEGERAYLRLQEEIIKYNYDHTIFAWPMRKKKFSGLLAPSPACFTGCANTVSIRSVGGREPFSMTNRGLSITLKITPWSSDTYLAFLDCMDKTKPKDRVDIGIFLRRLTEDDQYVRLSLSGKSIWLGPDPRWQDRPTSNRRVFVNQTFDSGGEKSCLEARQYGFELPSSLLVPSACVLAPHWSLKNRTAFLRPGGWGLVAVVDISSEHDGLSRIALGFDFDFHPICLLEEPFASGELKDYYNWSRVDPDAAEWAKIIEGSRVYRSSDHDGVWALRGHQLRGLHVLLARSFNDRGSLLKLQRCERRSPLVWKLEIDDLVGPFRNHYHKELRTSFGDRQNFQAAYGLKMTDEDLEEGDAILKAMHPLIMLGQAC